LARLLIATSNLGKLREVQAVLCDLSLELLTLRDFPGVPEAIEDGATFEENARRKAIHYARYTGCWTLADDSGLEVDALAGAPGVYSARYAGPQATDADNNAKLMRQIANVPPASRTARFRCAIALAEPSAPAAHPRSANHSMPDPQVLATSAGVLEGVITDQPRGANGFGYDPHFLVPARGLTSAELPPAEKNAISHRGQALRAIRPAIEKRMPPLD
jgi:XTP/dITP diphosphohydrolase